MRERTFKRVSRTNPRSASMRRNRRGRWMGKGTVSIHQYFARFQISESTDIGQRQRNAELALMFQRSQIVILVLDIDRETPEIIADPADDVLVYLLLKIVIYPECTTQPPAVRVTISHHGAEQVKGGQRRRRGGGGGSPQ